MRLLNLGKIYKKKSKKEVSSLPPQPAQPSKFEPLSLELNLDLKTSSSIGATAISTLPTTTPTTTSTTQSTPNHVSNTNTVTAGPGSLFDDIFAELGTSSKNNRNDISIMDNDFSLALALSQQLEIEDGTNKMTGTTKSGNIMSNNQEKTNNVATTAVAAPSFLFAGDSIYSSYLKNISALDNNDITGSMFDSILNKNAASNSSTTPTNATSATLTTPAHHVTQVVLDSDISDSDEESKISDNESEEEKGKAHRRRTRGIQPIMERRDQRLSVQRKIDNWTNRVDPESNRVESNDSMMERMKDRHRNQVKLAALRNQQLQQQDEYNNNNMMGYPPQQPHMVPQTYGAPTMMPSANAAAVLPRPGMLMDPAQMFYPPLQPPPISNMNYMDMNNNAPPPPPPVVKQQQPVVPLPASYLPNPTHATLAIPHSSKEEHEEDNETEEYDFEQQQSNRSTPSHVSPPVPSINNSRTNNSSLISVNHTRLSSTPSSTSSVATSHSNKNNNIYHSNSTTTLDQQLEQMRDSPIPMDSPSPDLEELQLIEEAAAEEADCEISGDELKINTTSLPKRKKSMKKLRQREEEVTPTVTRGMNDSGYTLPKQIIRSSRSAPNLKKKSGSSKKSVNGSSKSSSRRNSQDYSLTSPISEMVATPPPLPHHQSPYPNNHSDEHLYQLPRFTSHQQQLNPQRQPLRHMRSEPDLPRQSNSATIQQQKLYQQQQQLNLEWERMQNYQREQALKQQHQIPMMYNAPMYYPPSVNSMMMMDPYSQQQQFFQQQNASFNNPIMYQQQQHLKMQPSTSYHYQNNGRHH